MQKEQSSCIYYYIYCFVPISESSISFSDLPSLVFHVRGPLTLYPRMKLAAAEELEKSISSVVKKFCTLSESNNFCLCFCIPTLNDLVDVFSLTVVPANTTKPSGVTFPVELADLDVIDSDSLSSADADESTCEKDSSTCYPRALIRIFTLSTNSSMIAICDSFITVLR